MSAPGILLAAVCALALQAQNPAPATPQPMTSAQMRAEAAKSGYTGTTGCRNCHKHDAIWDNFPKNPHFNAKTAADTSGKSGCESCHGPGKAHVDAGGDIDTVVKPFSLMKPQEIISSCLACHGKEFQRANIRRSEHTQHDVACTACHSIHKSQTQRNLLAKTERELCYQCHADVRAQFSLPFKHRVNEGLMTCSDCHNPHGGNTPTFGMGQTSKMLKQAHSNEQPCMKCHVDKRGPFLFAHQAGEIDGCISCHKPHGSTTAKLITRPTTTMLCLECHTGSGDFGARTNRGITYPDHATHSMVDPRYQRCTGCHVAIHGSNVHYRFLR
ncbi:MAG: DmsE family decaheme c-type cytochrome [Bryobacteraceae bacterium]